MEARSRYLETIFHKVIQQAPLSWDDIEQIGAGMARFFLQAPPWELDDAKRRAFDRLYGTVQSHPGNEIAYSLPYPRHEFLRYLVAEKDVLLHGSNRSDLTVLLPRDQTDYSGRPTQAVFASGDGLWPMFFAIVDYSVYRGSMRNACFVLDQPQGPARRFYFFSLGREMLRKGCWTGGSVYLLPRATFSPTNTARARFDEWTSRVEVHPLARLAVAPDDFPFLHQVAGHKEGEPIFTSWLRYKDRIRRKR